MLRAFTLAAAIALAVACGSTEDDSSGGNGGTGAAAGTGGSGGGGNDAGFPPKDPSCAQAGVMDNPPGGQCLVGATCFPTTRIKCPDGTIPPQISKTWSCECPAETAEWQCELVSSGLDLVTCDAGTDAPADVDGSEEAACVQCYPDEMTCSPSGGAVTESFTLVNKERTSAGCTLQPQFQPAAEVTLTCADLQMCYTNGQCAQATYGGVDAGAGFEALVWTVGDTTYTCYVKQR